MMARHVSIRTLMSFFTVSVVVYYALAISDVKKSTTSSHVAKQVLASIGDIMSIALYLSQVPIYWTTTHKHELQGNSIFPCVMTLLNSLLWGLYSTSAVQYNLLVMVVCFFGVLVESCYFLIHFRYTPSQKKVKLASCFIVGLVIVGGCLTGLFVGFHDRSKRKKLLGVASVISGVFMYAAPCLDMYKSWRTKKAKDIPVLLSMVGLLNCSIWLAYSVLKVDKFMKIQNIFGLVLSFAQVVVFTVLYCIHTPGKGFYFLCS